MQKELDDIIKKIQKGETILPIRRCIPFQVSEIAQPSRFNPNELIHLVGITATTEGDIKFTAMSKEECREYIRNNYNVVLRNYFYSDLWEDVGVIKSEQSNG